MNNASDWIDSSAWESSSDWETVSDQLSLDRPVLKADVPKLAEVPLKTMLTSPSLEWLAPILSYSHPHKGYELQMVRFKIILRFL